jgi:hypothetical protein
MAVIPQTAYTNIPQYPKSWFWANGNFAAQTSAGNRAKLTSPSAIQIDCGGLSLTNTEAQELDLSLDATWDFGQSAVGTWTAGTSYAVGDWVRPATGGGDGANNVFTNYATPPAMGLTSNLDGLIITSSSPSSGTSYAWKAFDQFYAVSTYGWLFGPSPGWTVATLMAELGSAKIINKYRIRSAGGSPAHQKTWTFEGTNTVGAVYSNPIGTSDGSGTGNWKILDTQTNSANVAEGNWTSYFTFVNSTPYKYYRIRVTVGNDPNYLGIGELHLVAAPSLIYKCTTQGTALSTEPTWGTTVGGTTAESGGPTWTCYYDDTVASNRAGQDYTIYSCVGTSTVPKLVVSRNSTIPAGYTATTSRKIGGFHCLCASAGTISGHPLSGYLTGDILPTSVWDLKKRAKSLNNNGLAHLGPELDAWAYIYLPSGTATAPVSVYGGTILDTIDWNTAVDAGKAVKMRLFRDGEFQIAAALSNEQTNIYGSADPVTTGGHVDTAGRRMISKYGLEDCCGLHDQWLDESSYRFDIATAHYHKIASISGNAETDTSGNAVAVDGTTAVDISPAWEWKDLPLDKGQLYRQGAGATGYGVVKLQGGGNYGSGAQAGSRMRQLSAQPWLTSDYRTFRLLSPSLVR